MLMQATSTDPKKQNINGLSEKEKWGQLYCYYQDKVMI